MNNIDTRIVEMQFENGKFERDVNSTINLLEKLDNSLEFKNAATAFEGITAAANNVSLQGISDSVDWLKNHFSTVGRFITKEIDSVVGYVESKGKQMINALTIKPVTDGWEEYNTKVSATQTLLNNVSRLGEGMNDVSKALDKLNTYADKTIYSYGDMVSIMGQVSTAGLNTEQATDYVQGLSNLTAYLGKSNSDMYGLSSQATEALNKGYFQYQDWMSFMRRGYNAKVFEDTIVETAREAYAGTGVDIDKIISGAGSFARSLQESESAMPNWLTNDIYLAAIGKFNDSTTELGQKAFESATKAKTLQEVIGQVQESLGSGWSRTWEIVIGNVEQAKEFWTPIAEGITSITDSLTGDRNSLLQAVMVLERRPSGKHNSIISSVTGLLDNLKTILDAVGTAWREVVPSIKPKTIVDFLAKVSKFINNDLKPSEKGLNTIKGIVHGIGTVVRTLGVFAQGALKIVKPLAEIVWNLVVYVAEMTGAFGNFISGDGKAFDDWAEGFLAVCDAIGAFIKDIPKNLENLGKQIQEAWEKIRTIVKDRTGFDINQPFIDAYNAVSDFVGKVEKGIADGSLWQKVEDAVSPIGDFFKSLFGGDENSDNDISSMIGNTTANIIHSFDTLKSSLETLGLDGAVKELTDTLTDPVGKFKELFIGDEENPGIVDISDSLDAIYEFFSQVGEHLSEFWANIEPTVTEITNKLEPIWKPLMDILETLAQGLAKSLENFKEEGVTVQDIGSMGLLAASIFVANKVNELVEILKDTPKKLTDLVNAINSPFNRLVSLLVDTVGKENKKVAAETFEAYAFGIAAIIGACVAITYMNLDGLNAGLGAMAAVVMAMGVIVDKISKMTSDLSVATLSGMAIFLNQFGSTVLKIAGGLALIQWSGDNIKETALAVIAILASMLTIYKTVTEIAKLDPKNIINTESVAAFGGIMNAFGFALLEISAAIALLVKAYNSNGYGFAAAVAIIQILFLEMLALIKIFSGGNTSELSAFANKGTLMNIGIALIAIAAAIDILVAGIAAMALVGDPAKLWNAAAIVAGLAILVGVFFQSLKGITIDSQLAGNIVVISVALILIAVAVDILVAGITAVAAVADKFSWEDVVKSFTIVGIASIVLTLLVGVLGLLGEAGPEISLGFITGGVALILAAVAMNIMADGVKNLLVALQKIPYYDIDKIWPILKFLVILMLVLSAVSLLMMGGGIGGAAGIMAVAGAIWVYAQAISTIVSSLSSIKAFKPDELIKGLAAIICIAAMLWILTLTLAALSPFFIPLGIAAIEFGVAAFFIAQAFLAVAGGLSAIAAAGTVSSPVIYATAKAFTDGFIDGVTDGLIDFIGRIPEIIESLGASFIKILDALQTIIIDFLVWNASSTVTGLIKVVNAFAGVVGPLIARLVAVLIDLTVQILKGLNAGLDKNKHRLAYYIGNIIAIILEIIVEALYVLLFKLGEWLNQISPQIFQEVLKLGEDMVDNLCTGITESLHFVEESVGKIADAILNGIFPKYSEVKQKAEKFVQKLTGAIGTYLSDDEGVAAGLVKMFQAGKEGVENFWKTGSPSKVMQDEIVRDGLIAGVVSGFDLYGDQTVKAMEENANDMFSAYNSELTNMDMSALFNDLDPTITPLVDLSEVENAFSQIDTMTPKTTMDFAAITSRTWQAKSIREQHNTEATQKRIDELFNSLTNRDASLIEAITGASEDTKIYLDNDVLVGQLYRGMNSKLGKATTIQRRQ